MAIDILEDAYQQFSKSIPLTGLHNGVPELEQQNAQIREAIYLFLASVYLQPVIETSLQQMCDETFLDELIKVLPGDATVEFTDFLSSLEPGSLSSELAALKKEYMRLFAVPTGHYVAPFEDIYRGKSADGQPLRGPLLGVRAIAVKRMYREAGAQMDELCKELPNHVGVELSFMRFLCEREAAIIIDNNVSEQGNNEAIRFSQLEIYRAYQVRFLSEHLSGWFPQLNEEIQNKSDHVFYKSLANMTQAYLQQDLAMLKQQLINHIQQC